MLQRCYTVTFQTACYSLSLSLWLSLFVCLSVCLFLSLMLQRFYTVTFQTACYSLSVTVSVCLSLCLSVSLSNVATLLYFNFSDPMNLSLSLSLSLCSKQRKQPHGTCRELVTSSSLCTSSGSFKLSSHSKRFAFNIHASPSAFSPFLSFFFNESLISYLRKTKSFHLVQHFHNPTVKRKSISSTHLDRHLSCRIKMHVKWDMLLKTSIRTFTITSLRMCTNKEQTIL